MQQGRRMIFIHGTNLCRIYRDGVKRLPQPAIGSVKQIGFGAPMRYKESPVPSKGKTPKACSINATPNLVISVSSLSESWSFGHDCGSLPSSFIWGYSASSVG